ncbi:MAG TPA: alpha/beta hydrolase-fold protein [Chthonomonadaceae bacterium]|nr:alpha/beta hydrolase-fold protein [Chthonomonadaceae bacterium]
MKLPITLLWLTLIGAVASSSPPASAQQPLAGAPQPPGRRFGGGGRQQGAPPIQPKPEELAAIKAKTEQIEAAVADLRAQHADPVLLNDVAVFAHAGRMLLEFPELFGTQNAIDHAMGVLDRGIERGQQLKDGKPEWDEGPKRIEAYRSEIDGSLQPYGVSLPANYDPAKPARLYVWLHGRQNNTTEAEFIYGFLRQRPGFGAVADQGQIQVDCFGRINSAGWHWAGEADIFEAIAAMKRRYKIDDKRIVLRGFSMGGEGAWHIALHYPDRFVAAEIGAGTTSRRGQNPDLEPYQRATTTIWENISEWSLNIFNLPLAGHDGEQDPGQLESSLRARAQLEKEGFPSEGEKDYLHSVGAPGLWMVSLNTGHGTSPLVRQRLDAFLKEWANKGQTSPDHIRFVTHTTRYNRDYWASVDGMDRHYERADVDAVRSDGGRSYAIKTHNVSRLVLREADRAREVKIDGQALKVRPGASIALEKSGGAWRQDRGLKQAGLHKTHALQGPIDDAFLDPFLLVRPTGTPWNEAANSQALRSMARFDRLWAKFFRGHPFVKDDKDVTAADIAKYHLVLFGDPGSNRLIPRVLGKLPVTWTKSTVTLAGKEYPASDCYPALIYPNPLNPAKYVVLNTGLTISDRDYNGDYGMPRWGDYAVVKAVPGGDIPEVQTAGLFDESWQLPK